MKFSGLVAAAAFAVGATVASAAPVVSNLGDGAAAFAYVDETQGTANGGWTSFDAGTKAGSVDGSWRSPYETSGIDGWKSLEYFSVGPSTSTPATMVMDGVYSVLSLLWGSVDDYNNIEFFLSGASQGSVGSSDIDPKSYGSDSPATGASYVKISGISFDKVVFTSNTNAFEFANVVAAVPLPAGGLLLLAGLGGLALVRRRKDAA